MTFVDTNVLIDILMQDNMWSGWSVERLSDASCAGPTMINVIVIGEMSRNYGSVAELMTALAPLGVVNEAIDEASAFLAGQRFSTYRKSRNADGAYRVLPDFFIGAHALTLGAPLLTRDPTLYRRYFPELTLITPEMDDNG